MIDRAAGVDATPATAARPDPRAQPALPVTRWRDGWPLLAVLAAAALVVRLIGLDGGLWLDEMIGIVDYLRSPFDEILMIYKGDGQHPLYALFGHASIVLFGEHAWSVRLPAALFGAATVPLLYLVTRSIGTKREALLTALLLTVSYHHVWFSQNARGYTMLTFLVLLGTYCLLRGLRDGGRGWYLGYAVAMAFGAYTHLTVVFPSLAHFVIALWQMTKGRARWPDVLLGFGGAAALTLLLYAPILDQVVSWFLYRPSNLEGISTPAWALEEGLRMLRRGFAGGGSVIAGGAALIAAGTILAAGALSFARAAPLALALFTLPVFTTFGGALLARGTMYPRFFFFLMPYALIIIVRGMIVVGQWLGGRLGRGATAGRAGSALGTAAAGIAILLSALSLEYNYRYPKQDFGGALEYVESNRRANETILMTGAVRRAYRDYYQRSWPEVTTPDALDSLGGTGGYWLIYTFPRYVEADSPALMERIEQACRERTVFPGTVGDGDIIVCRIHGGLSRS